MKTNDERKNEIISKLRSLAELKEEREHIDFELEKAITMNNSDLSIDPIQAFEINDKLPSIMDAINNMNK